MGSMDFDFDGTYLLMIARRKVIHWAVPGTGKFRADLTPFPSPRIVGGFYEMLLGKPSGDGFHKRLAPRTRGPAPSAYNLIPACVAFYLRNNGKIQSPKEIHRLLNEHVLRETHKVLPEGDTNSESSQLWQDVNNPIKVRNPLFDVERTLYSEGDI
jgi:hypothetical protein